MVGLLHKIPACWLKAFFKQDLVFSKGNDHEDDNGDDSGDDNDPDDGDDGGGGRRWTTVVDGERR